MDINPVATEDLRRQALDKFWEAFPPFWQQVRAYIRQVAMENFSITVEQFHILRHIHKGQNSISELAKARHISRPGVSQVVDALVNQGLITRTQSQQDRRHVRLDLTEKGDALLDAISENTRQWMLTKLASLSADELHAISQASEALRKAFLP